MGTQEGKPIQVQTLGFVWAPQGLKGQGEVQGDIQLAVGL